MLRLSLAVARKDLALSLARGNGLVQALLLGLLLRVACLLLLFVFSLAQGPGERVGPQAAAAMFWLSSAFSQVLIFNRLYDLEEVNAARLGLALCPAPEALPVAGAVSLALVDVGMCALGSLLGALAQGQSGRESLLGVILFPLLTPLLLAGIGVGAQCLGAPAPDGPRAWLGLAAAFDAVFLGAGLVLFGFLYPGED